MESKPWNLAGLAYGVIIAAAAVMLVISIPFGAYAALYTHIYSSTGPQYGPQNEIAYLPIYVGLLPVDISVTPTFGALFIGLTAVYCVAIGLALLGRENFVRALISAGRGGPQALFDNAFSATIVLLGGVLLATVLLQEFQSAVGVGTGGLSGNPFLLFMDLTLSPLIEEVGYRFFLIGVPLAVLLLAGREPLKRIAKALWRPSAAWDADPTQQPGQIQLNAGTLKAFTYFLIALSSILFGLAHYLSGAGWEVGKISEAALDGVALAYLYVRYGLHASIIFHWAVDYASNAFAFYGQGVYGISWTAGSVWSNVPTEVILVFVGIPGLLLILNSIFKWAIRPRGETPADDSSRPLYPDPAGGTVQGNLSDDT